jgi:UDP-N-acetylmuramoyl-L-alanyl-D-glutamate--2,6-diaminopimelate ligase
MTTLEATQVQERLARAVHSGMQAMGVEASSEGLAQHRLDGCDFDVAVFTNLSRDHLDFHGTMENYLIAKGLLFVQTDRTEGKPYAKAAVINGDDAASTYLLELTALPAITYGFGNANDLQAFEIETAGFGLHFRVRAGGSTYNAEVPLIGGFNVYNSLAAAAVARSQGTSLSDAFAALSSFPGITGRLERIERGQPFSVFVDIASTPVALENTLAALRPGTRGRLWVVFGAAGGRDPARRDGMGRVAGRLADFAVLTSEDPRDEDPDAIIETIAAGLRETGRKEGTDFVRRADRREAIRYAFEHAEPGDTVLLAGKSTETTMVVRGESIPWDERALAAELLEGR